MKIEDILNEREKTHGDFKEFANFRMKLNQVFADHLKSKQKYPIDVMSNAKWVAIGNILTKLSRIMCGDPNHADHWDDIAGYAKLGRGKKEGQCTCYTVPGTEEFVKCRKCQNRKCSICHVALENGFFYGPCQSIPPRIECNLYFCWDCAEKHENNTSSKMERTASEESSRTCKDCTLTIQYFGMPCDNCLYR